MNQMNSNVENNTPNISPKHKHGAVENKPAFQAAETDQNGNPTDQGKEAVSASGKSDSGSVDMGTEKEEVKKEDEETTLNTSGIQEGKGQEKRKTA